MSDRYPVADDGRVRVQVPAPMMVPGTWILSESGEEWRHLYSASTHRAGKGGKVQVIWDGPADYRDRMLLVPAEHEFTVAVPAVDHLPGDTKDRLALDARLRDPRAWNSVSLTAEERRTAQQWLAELHTAETPDGSRHYPPTTSYDLAQAYFHSRRLVFGLRAIVGHARAYEQLPA